MTTELSGHTLNHASQVGSPDQNLIVVMKRMTFDSYKQPSLVEKILLVVDISCYFGKIRCLADVRCGMQGNPLLATNFAEPYGSARYISWPSSAKKATKILYRTTLMCLVSHVQFDAS